MDAPAKPVEGLPAGTRFGPWSCVRPLAAGGMAELYLAAHREDPTARLAAIKRLLPHLSWDPEFVAMFLAEVRIAAGLDHPNVVHVLDFGVGEGGHYFAMEYLHGRDLRALLRDAAEAGYFPLDVAVGIVLEVAAGLAYAHAFVDPQGNRLEVVHRDVSPSNVLVCYDGRVKLLDFGIARVTAQTRQTRAGTVKGKIGYMSPEQCRGDTVDRRSDVFGLGILLYELTLGRRAFFGDNEFAVMNRVVDGDYVRPCAIVPEYPPALEAIIDRALEPEPADRYPTADAMIEALRAFIAAHPMDVGPRPRQRWMEARFGRPPLPVVDLEALQPARRRGAWRGVALLVAALGVGVGGFLLGNRVRSDPSPPPPPAAERADAVPATVAVPISTPVPIPGSGAAEPAREPEETLELLDEGELDTEADEVTNPAGPSRRVRRHRPRRTARTATAPDPAPRGPTGPSGEQYLLPSRRDR